MRDAKLKRAARYLAWLALLAAGCNGGGASGLDAGPAGDAARELGGGDAADDAAALDGGAPDTVPWPACSKPWQAGAAPCRPTFDTCQEDKLPLPGGGCKRVGVVECPGGLQAPPAWTCTGIGPPVASCRQGWSKSTSGSTTTARCEPILPPAACSGATMAVIGQTSCQSVGDCGSGTWGKIVTGPGTLFVDGAYTGGGSDGSKTKPYTTIGAALQAAAAGAQIAVAAGTYGEDVLVDKALTLEGRCPQLVTIKGQQSGTFDAAVKIKAGGAVVRGLTATGPAMGVYATGAAAQASLQQLVIQGCGDFGLAVDLGAKLTAKETLVSANTRQGVYVDGADLTLERAAVRDTKPDPALGDLGYGVVVKYLTAYALPASLKVVDSVLSGNRAVAVYIVAAGATIEGSVVRDTKPDGKSNEGGIGLLVYTTSQQQATLTLKESLLAGNRSAGLNLSDAAATVERTVIRDTEGRLSDKKLGVGILAESNKTSSSLTLRESLVTNNTAAGLLIRGSQATVERCVIERTRAQLAPQEHGSGLQVFKQGLPSTATLRDSLVADNRTAGALVRDSTLVVERSVIRDTKPRLSDAVAGFGIGALGEEGTPVLKLRDSLISGNRTASLVLVGADATLERSVIRDTASEAATKEFGDGVSVMPGKSASTLTMSDCVVARSREAGIAIWDATATIRGCLVSKSAVSDLTAAYGDGIAVSPSKGLTTSLTLTDSVVDDSARAGVFFDKAGGEVHQSAIRRGVFSVVLEQGASPTLGPSNLYQGNKQDKPSAQGITPVKPPKVPSL